MVLACRDSEAPGVGSEGGFSSYAGNRGLRGEYRVMVHSALGRGYVKPIGGGIRIYLQELALGGKGATRGGSDRAKVKYT